MVAKQYLMNKKIKRLFIIYVIFSLFAGPGIYALIGWDIYNTALPVIFRFTPAFYLITYVAIVIYNHKLLGRKYKHQFNIFFFICGLLIFYSAILGRNQAITCLISCIIPFLLTYISITFLYKTNLRLQLQKYILYFFIVECIIAIFEKITHQFLLGANDIVNVLDFTEQLGFRSRALHGHPLNNALIIDIIMSFILISGLKERSKLLLWFMGYIALLCFNTRSSILIMPLFLLIYIIHGIFNKKISLKSKFFYLFFILVIPSIILTLIFDYGFGGRLIESEIMDGSAQSRITILDVFINTPTSYYIFGHDINLYMLDVIKYTHNSHLENYWIDFIIQFGLIFFIPILCLIIKFLKRLLFNYSNFEKLILCGTFIIISSTNNSLSNNGTALCIFTIACYAFDRKMLNLFFNKNKFEIY